MEPEGPPQARRLDGAACGSAFITMLFFAPVFWPFWRPWGDGNMFFDDGEGNTFYKLNNFNFTGPLIILVGGRHRAGYWHFSGKKWFTGPKVQGTPEELRGHRARARCARARQLAPTDVEPT